MSLCNPLMLSWVAELRERIPGHAIRAEVGENGYLQERLELGLLDCVLVYHPSYWPGLQVEPVLEERLIQVRNPAKPEPYVYVDWGEPFRQRHDAALPERARASLAFNLGPLALQYLLQQGGSGYFRSRVVEHYLPAGRSSACRRRPNSATRSTWSIRASATARYCARPSASCTTCWRVPATGRSAGIR